jgi:DNA-binding transcriptional LysR family regulator
MSYLNDVQLFVEVSQAGSISAGGRKLGLSPAAASAAIKRLEARLQSQLFERSTRSLRLTPAGEDFLSYGMQALALLHEGQEQLGTHRHALSGDIHLGAPSDLARDRLDQALEAFRREHPQVRLIMHLSDGMHDLYRFPVDLVVRYGLLRDSNLIAHKLCDNDRVVCAAPVYLKKHGRPTTLDELKAHNCICFYLGGEIYNRWRIGHEGRMREITVQGDRVADDGAMVRQWAVQGAGIAYKSRLDIQSDLDNGRLVDLFPEAQGEQSPLYAVYPSRRYQPLRLQTLLVHLQDFFGTKIVRRAPTRG